MAKIKEPKLKTDKKYQQYIKNVQLPQWLEKETEKDEKLWSEKHPLVFTLIGKKSSVEILETNETYPTIEDAYDSIDTSNVKEIIFDESLKKYNHVDKKSDLKGFIFATNKNSNRLGSRLLSTINSPESTRDDLKYNYRRWIEEVNPVYQKNPNQWDIAYQWIEHHPMFWTKAEIGDTIYWETDGGMERTNLFMFNKKGKPVIALETGGHVEDGYGSHYLDLDLNTNAKNFEQAIVKLAKKINEFYYSNGLSKKDIDGVIS